MKCHWIDMNLWMMLLAAQVIVTAIAFVRGARQDKRFEDGKLDYRS